MFLTVTGPDRDDAHSGLAGLRRNIPLSVTTRGKLTTLTVGEAEARSDIVLGRSWANKDSQ